MATPLLGFAVSKLPEIEQWLRIVSLCTGILVGFVTIGIQIYIAFIKKRKADKLTRESDHQQKYQRDEEDGEEGEEP